MVLKKRAVPLCSVSQTAGLLLVMCPDGGLRPDFLDPGVADGAEDAGWGADSGDGVTDLWSSRAMICSINTAASTINLAHVSICVCFQPFVNNPLSGI